MTNDGNISGGCVVDDWVEYHIYCLQQGLGEEELGTLFKEVREYSDELIGGLANCTYPYIWHKQAFCLEVATHPRACLHGKTVVGDCIEDEWLVVYLLHSISKRFGELAISVLDGDGQFLLIEAAEHLPRWVRPEIMNNRVFLVKGELHIIEDLDFGTLTIHEALLKLSDDTSAPNSVQKAAFLRIQGYPEVARAQRQLTQCLIPRKVAHLLYHDASLVAAATEAYYLRDPIGLKACQTMETFPPCDLVLASVQFTRTLYAQLAFQPLVSPLPKPFAALEGINLHDVSVDLGFKLTCGFELLMTKGGRNDFARDAKYALLKAHMTGEGYFEGEAEGSARYQELERRLQEQYIFSKPKIDAPASKISSLLLSYPDYIDDSVLAEHRVASDSLAWLELTPDSLQEALQAKKYTEPEGDLLDGDEVGEEVRRLVENVSLFMTQDTGLEGAERIRDEIRLEDSDDDIELDPAAFMKNLQDLLTSKPSKEPEIDKYSAMMEFELQNTKVFRDHHDEDSDSSLDVDLNLAKNLLASYHAQSQDGPASSFMDSE